MTAKTRYTDEPMEVGRVLADFLPPPERLAFKEDSVKVTISLSSKSVRFFKAEAAKRGVQYQRMIRRLLDAYVDAFGPAGPAAAFRGIEGSTRRTGSRSLPKGLTEMTAP